MAIPIRIHPTFWIFAALIGWMSSFDVILTLVWMVIILVSVLIHEFGHALTARYFQQSSTIELMAFGGITQRTGPKLKPWQEFVIVFNGPLFGLFLAIAASLLFQAVGAEFGDLLAYTLSVTAAVNLFWTVVNLLPVQPLDGGKLLKIVLEKLFGFRGIKWSILLSFILCALIGVVFFTWGSLIGGSIFFMLAYENFRGWKAMQGMTEEDQDAELWKELGAAEFAIKSGNYDRAWTLLVQLKERVHGGLLKNHISQMMSALLFAKKQYGEAYALLDLKKLTPDFVQTAQQIAFRSGHYDEAIDCGNRAYQETPAYEIALINAYCFAKKGETVPAVGWLRRAQNDGVPNFLNILKEEVFDAVRATPEFQQLKK